MSPRSDETRAAADDDFVARLERERLNFRRAQQLIASAAAERAAATTTRGVRFHPEVKKYLVDHLSSFSKSEIANSWYSPRDLEQVVGDMRVTVKAARRQEKSRRKEGGHRGDEEKICDRGLEHLRSASHMELRKVSRDVAFARVLEEQARQRREGISDGELLREASEMGSERARNYALDLGRQDEDEAKKIREEDMREARRALAEQTRKAAAAAAASASAGWYEALERALGINGVGAGSFKGGSSRSRSFSSVSFSGQSGGIPPAAPSLLRSRSLGSLSRLPSSSSSSGALPSGPFVSNVHKATNEKIEKGSSVDDGRNGPDKTGGLVFGAMSSGHGL